MTDTLMSSRRIVPVAGLLVLVLSIAASRSSATLRNSARLREKNPCALLSTADASTALEQPSQPGAPEFGTGCVWSPQSPPKDTSRKVLVNFHDVAAYNIAKHGNALTKIESFAGLGDDAFYQLYAKGGYPFLWVKKGDQAISIRISTGTKVPLFSEAQLKSKLLVLGKVAVAKM
jgi:hypothetical protein